MSAPGQDMRARVAAVKQRVALSALIGRTVKLVRRGREFAGLCPFHQERSPSFTVVDERDFYHCFGCGAHGDAIRFVMDHEGVEFREALERLEQDAGLAQESATRRQTEKRQRPNSYVDGRNAAAMVWREALPARGTIAERWEESRGLDPAASGALDVCRFHPRCPASLWRTWERPADARRSAPALVAPILRVSGRRGERALSLAGVHVTFLAPDGRGKAYFEPWKDRQGKLVHPPRRVMWGAAARGAVLMPARPLPQGLDPDQIKESLVELLDAPGVLVVGEGRESTLSLAAREPEVRLACATLSLGNLEGVPVRVGKSSAVPLWNLRGEPELGAPFTVAEPGRVLIGVDADMKPTQPLWVQEARGSVPVRRVLNSRERSDKCAALAAWHWRRAGAEWVRVARPPMGADFNDLDREMAA